MRIKSNDHEYEDGRAITCDIEKKIITLYSDSYLNNYRNNNYYGYSEWNLNTPKEVTGLAENGDQDETEYKDIIKLVDDILYLGNVFSKDEDTGYPTEYSTPGFERID